MRKRNILCRRGGNQLLRDNAVPFKGNRSAENLSIKTERIENELFVSVDHEMTKTHYISFMALIGYDGAEIKKLYPEGNAETRFRYGGGILYIFCNRHGLMKIKI